MKKVLLPLMMVFLATFALAETNIYAPTLTAPANGASNQSPVAMMDWGAVAGAWTYKVEIDVDSNFSNPVTFNTTFSAVNNSNLLFGTTYYWRVKAMGVSDSSDWSARWSFNTIDLVTVTAPVDSTFGLNPAMTITWTGIAGVTHYDWQVDSVITFDSPLFRTAAIASPIVTTTSSQLNFGQNYYLRMRARHSVDTTNWSTPVMFSTIDTLALIRPLATSDTLYTPSFQMRWGYIKAKYYDIALAFDSLMTSPQIITVDSGSCATNYSGVVQYMVTLPVLEFGKTYWWTVRARNAFDTTAWMTSRRFYTDSTVTLYAPANAATEVSTMPQFDWRVMAGTDNFVLQYDMNSGFTAPTTINTDTVSKFTVTSELEGFETYYWRVRSMTSVDTSIWSTVRSFTTGSGIGVTEQSWNSENISIYPNPCQGKLGVEIESAAAATITLNVSNILGQQLISNVHTVKAGKNNIQLNLDHLTDGIYLLTIQGEKNTITRKVILDR